MIRQKGLSARAPGREREVLQVLGSPELVFLQLCFCSPSCPLQTAGLGWLVLGEEQAWRTGEACLLQNPIPIAAVCGGASSWAFGALRSLNWACPWLSLLFAKSFVTQHLLSSF